ncbi:probable LRR receptor-like serine/threonine-protein kinase RFK1 [Camellia sinensis]|uniref:probable LRR receptor-like serine/threonine-protein kinase RFK1 n=1 Tax=Camellia sinensis TaxID=4442 RepID=UPI0010356F02|nr:probable LRR receptor-like serine/threonine-protein kinase RFK1 [Camellia sinensis]
MNLFESSSTGNMSGIVSCLRSFQCPQKVTLDGNTKYEADTDSGGPSRFFLSGTNWAFSSTGYFLDSSSSDFFICTNSSRLSMKDSDLYVNA